VYKNTSVMTSYNSHGPKESVKEQHAKSID